MVPCPGEVMVENCHTTIMQGAKLVTSPKGPTPQWRHDHQEGQVSVTIPVKLLPRVFARNSRSGNVPEQSHKTWAGPLSPFTSNDWANSRLAEPSSPTAPPVCSFSHGRQSWRWQFESYITGAGVEQESSNKSRMYGCLSKQWSFIFWGRRLFGDSWISVRLYRSCFRNMPPNTRRIPADLLREMPLATEWKPHWCVAVLQIRWWCCRCGHKGCWFWPLLTAQWSAFHEDTEPPNSSWSCFVGTWWTVSD